MLQRASQARVPAVCVRRSHDDAMPCPCGGAAAAAGSSSAYDRSGRQHTLRGANGTFFPRRRLVVSRRHPHLVAGPRITESDYPTVQVDAAHIDSSRGNE